MPDPLSDLTARLARLRTAKDELLTGKAVAVVQGEGRRVEYVSTPQRAAALDAEIARLEGQVARHPDNADRRAGGAITMEVR